MNLLTNSGIVQALDCSSGTLTFGPNSDTMINTGLIQASGRSTLSIPGPASPLYLIGNSAQPPFPPPTWLTPGWAITGGTIQASGNAIVQLPGFADASPAGTSGGTAVSIGNWYLSWPVIDNGTLVTSGSGIIEIPPSTVPPIRLVTIIHWRSLLERSRMMLVL